MTREITLSDPMLTDTDSPRVGSHASLAEHAAADKSQASLGEVKLHVLRLIRMEGELTGVELNDMVRDRAERYGWRRVSWDSPRKRAGEMLGSLLFNMAYENPSEPVVYALTAPGIEVAERFVV